jgi:hypothetical protein
MKHENGKFQIEVDGMAGDNWPRVSGGIWRQQKGPDPLHPAPLRQGWLATETVSSEAARQLAVLPPAPLIPVNESLLHERLQLDASTLIRVSDKDGYLQPKTATIRTEA